MVIMMVLRATEFATTIHQLENGAFLHVDVIWIFPAPFSTCGLSL